MPTDRPEPIFRTLSGAPVRPSELTRASYRMDDWGLPWAILTCLVHRRTERKESERPSDIWITELAAGTDGARQKILARRHPSEMGSPLEMWRMKFGTAVHSMIEDGAPLELESGVPDMRFTDSMTALASADDYEVRVEIELDQHHDRRPWLIGGRIDWLDRHDPQHPALYDWKTTSVYNYKRLIKGLEKEVALQAQLYSGAAQHLGLVEAVPTLHVGCIFYDWHAGMLRNSLNRKPGSLRPYPPVPYMTFDVDRDSTGLPAKDEYFKLESLARDYVKHLDVRDDDLPRCDDGRYQYVNPKTGAWARDGVPARCVKYCGISAYCSQFRRTMEGRA